MPFTWNEPFELSVYGRAQSILSFDCCGFGILDATLDGFNIFNANQQRVTRYTIASAANAPYAVTAVPEPGSLVLLGMGLAGGYGRRRWTHRGH